MIGGGRMAVARRCSGMADDPERGLSRYCDYGLTRFVAHGNDASSSEKMHRYNFFLRMDVSTSGLGAVLTQNFPKGERVIAYASRTLKTAEKNYSATELKCLDVI